MEIKQSVTMTATSTTDSGEVIAYFNASISNANSNISMNIQNQALYDANKKIVRSDKTQFDEAVYAVEDKQTLGS
ncbi:hypothetical protein ACT5YT_07990 [Leuconostoc suionicum]|uniref:hypothetical protein n=1 Tax=Leuconostoc suionicum TaxID=1511761 RepID=UPI0040367C25